MKYLHLCLHTLRADCNGLSIVRMKLKCTFASTRSVQIATVKSIGNRLHTIFASTRSVQIATGEYYNIFWKYNLCLHTLRADCNNDCVMRVAGIDVFASTRSVQIATLSPTPFPSHMPFASTRSVQIATRGAGAQESNLGPLPPHAPCRLQLCFHGVASIHKYLCLHTLRADCNDVGETTIIFLL